MCISGTYTAAESEAAELSSVLSRPCIAVLLWQQQHEGNSQRQMVEAVDIGVVPLLWSENITLFQCVTRYRWTTQNVVTEDKTSVSLSRCSSILYVFIKYLFVIWWQSPQSRSAALEREHRSSSLDRPAVCTLSSLDKPPSAASSSAAATAGVHHNHIHRSDFTQKTKEKVQKAKKKGGGDRKERKDYKEWMH